jgi:hypothetical protein
MPNLCNNVTPWNQYFIKIFDIPRNTAGRRTFHKYPEMEPSHPSLHFKRLFSYPLPFPEIPASVVGFSSLTVARFSKGDPPCVVPEASDGHPSFLSLTPQGENPELRLFQPQNTGFTPFIRSRFFCKLSKGKNFPLEKGRNPAREGGFNEKHPNE